MEFEFDGVDTEDEWGIYVPGNRIEIERGGWTPIALTGWGPGSEPLEDAKFYLVQRADESPHPLRWHSKAYPSVQEARNDGIRLKVREKGVEYPARSLAIPYVSAMAFDHHHSPYGCASDGSVNECGNNHECVNTAVLRLRDIVEDAALLDELLNG